MKILHHGGGLLDQALRHAAGAAAALSAGPRDAPITPTCQPRPSTLGPPHPSWRGVPICPCGESLVSQARTASTLCMRTGEDNQGVIGLRRSRIPGRERSSRKEG
ncbi:hypothetical protein [Streptomyces agglomeratus]|uniref:hypothetical protein n=1 Tax=Streptomyces agglomeratus TaxID=285458 RepID=UPI003F731573